MSWKEHANKLEKTFTFPDFLSAIDFVEHVAIIAEKMQHHPNMLIEYNKVTITTSTHDAGNIVTAKDYKLAKEIDELV